MVAPSVDLSVIVPCFNEEGNLPELVERTERVFDRRGIVGEIVLVNDGSRDGTGAQIDAIAARNPRVIGVHHPVNRGIPAGWKSGLERSRGRYVCTIDADLQYQPEAIAQLHREMTFSGADLVQGWRSPLERQRYDIRYYMSRGLDYILKFAFDLQQHDVKSGFILYKREVLEELLPHAPRYAYFQSFIGVAAKAKGFSIRQLETLFEERRAGHSFISRVPFAMVARHFADMGRALVEFRLREPKDQSLALALAERSPRPPARDRRWRGRYTRAYQALMPAHHWMISSNAPRYLDELRRTQWLAAEEIEQLQVRRLRRMLQHAYDHVGYYRELLQRTGVVPDEVRTLADLRRIPLLSKQALRDNVYFDLLSDNHDKRKIQKIVTCGADGELLALFVDRLQLDMRWANAWRNLEWTGYRFPERQVRLWRSRLGLKRRQIVREWLDAILSRRTSVPSFALADPALGRALERVRRLRPALLDGCAEILNVVATRLAGDPVPGLRVEAIVSSAQTLTPEARALVETQLGGRVFDEYGAREFGAVAHECEAHGGYHVNAESYIVEIVGRDGRAAADGELGTVVVTDLNNRCLPLVRYVLGDLAVATRRRCPCRRGLPLLERIVGRAQAMVLGSEGRHVPASFFAHLFKEYEYAVQRYQVVQDVVGELRLRIVRKSRFTETAQEGIHRSLAQVLGSAVQVRFELVEAIDDGPEGKPQPCICRVPLPLFSPPEDTEEARREATS